MLKKLKLSTQLNVSFYSLIGLMIIVALVAYMGLVNGQKNFVDYRELAQDTNLASRLQANMLNTRLNVLKYVDSDSPATLENYRKSAEKMRDDLDQAKVEIQQPLRAAKIKESTNLIGRYTVGFDQVVQLIAERHQVVKQDLDSSGLSMRKKMTEIMEYTHNIDNQEALYSAAKVQEALLLGRLYVVKFLVSNADGDYQRARQELEVNIKDDFTTLQNSLKSDKSRSLMNEFTPFYDKYLVALKQVYTIINERNDMINSTLNTLGPVIIDEIEKVALSVKADQDKLGLNAQNNAEYSVILVEIIALLSLVIGIGAAYFLPKVIREPIGGEPREIANIAEIISKGDLSQTFAGRENATGIYRSIARMNKSLRELIGAIVASGNSIADSAANADALAKQTSVAVLEQRERTSQVATAISQMSSSIQEMVYISTQSAESAKEAQSQAENGKATVDSAVASIGSLASRVENSVKMIKSLEQNSLEIGSVIEVIKNISEQTNLLALNAAIEAARAGEQGRGFAVVADEVRSLAQRTKESTSVIQNTVEALQQGTQNAVKSMEESGKEALATVEQSSATGQALDSVLSTIINITEMNRQVALAVGEQSKVVEDISSNVTAIAAASDITAEAASETAKASSHISQLAEEQKQSVRGFKV
jgi:methyl-accepting chemotaxis protein